MFRLIFLIVFTAMPQEHHSLGLNFSSLIGSMHNSTGKTLHELCGYFCDEGDYSDDLFEDLIDEDRPRILCFICRKKGLPTKSPNATTTSPTTSTSTTTTTTTAKPTTITTTTSTPTTITTTTSTPTPTTITTTTPTTTTTSTTVITSTAPTTP